MHGTGRRRAGACTRFRAPLRRGPAPPGENAAQTRDTSGAEPENGGGYAELSLRPSGAHANVKSQCPEAERKAATGEFRTALRSDREGAPAPRKARVRGA